MKNTTAAGFFENDWFQQKLASAAASWLGTPFVPHAQMRGAGVDCIHLCVAIYQEAGFMDSFTPPRYTIDAGAHQAESQILDWLSSHRDFVPVFASAADKEDVLEALLPGDLLVFKIGVSEHHCAVLLGRKKFIHARAGVSAVVATDSLTDPIYKRCLTFAFRPALQHAITPSLTVGLPPEA